MREVQESLKKKDKGLMKKVGMGRIKVNGIIEAGMSGMKVLVTDRKMSSEQDKEGRTEWDTEDRDG